MLVASTFPAFSETVETIEFQTADVGKTPAGFTSLVSGGGSVGEWKVILDEVPSAFSTLTSAARATSSKPVLAQTSVDPTDERFPLLVWDRGVFGDFRLTTRLKTVSGNKEQMAGIAFRFQDERNYYVVRLSTLGKTLRFYKFVDGYRSQPLGPSIDLRSDIWYELKIECAGNKIRCYLDGKLAMPELNDTSFHEGKIGFWTKSDSISHFAKTTIDYTKKETLAETMVRETLINYPRILGLSIYARTPSRDDLHVIASHDKAHIGQRAGETENTVYAKGVQYAGRSDTARLVTLPLRDRNGEVIAAVRFELKDFPGQRDTIAVARVAPILNKMQTKALRASDLFR